MTRREQVGRWCSRGWWRARSRWARRPTLLGLSERSVWRLRARFLRGGTGGPRPRQPGTVAGPPARRATRQRILELAGDHLRGAQRHATSPSCSPSARASRSAGSPCGACCAAAGRASPRRRRAPRHRCRRDRMPQAGLLLQADGSRHDWLGDRGPRLTLVARHRRRHGHRHRGHVPRPGGRGGLPRRCSRDRPSPRRAGRPLPRPPHHLRALRPGPRRSRSSWPTGGARPRWVGRSRSWASARSPPGARRRRAASSGSGAPSRTGSWRSCASPASPTATPPNRFLPPLPAPLQPRASRCRPPIRRPAWRPLARGAPRWSASAASLPARRRQRPHRPGGGHHPPAAAGTGPQRLCRAATWSSSSGSTAASSVWDGDRAPARHPGTRRPRPAARARQGAAGARHPCTQRAPAVQPADHPWRAVRRDSRLGQQRLTGSLNS